MKKLIFITSIVVLTGCGQKSALYKSPPPEKNSPDSTQKYGSDTNNNGHN